MPMEIYHFSIKQLWPEAAQGSFRDTASILRLVGNGFSVIS